MSFTQISPTCARSVTVARSSAVQASGAGEEVGHRLWFHTVAIHRLGAVDCDLRVSQNCKYPRIIICARVHTLLENYPYNTVCSQCKHYVGLVNLPNSSTCPMFPYSRDLGPTQTLKCVHFLSMTQIRKQCILHCNSVY